MDRPPRGRGDPARPVIVGSDGRPIDQPELQRTQTLGIPNPPYRLTRPTTRRTSVTTQSLNRSTSREQRLSTYPVENTPSGQASRQAEGLVSTRTDDILGPAFPRSRHSNTRTSAGEAPINPYLEAVVPGTRPTETFSHLPPDLVARFHEPSPQVAELERRALISWPTQHPGARPSASSARLPGAPSYENAFSPQQPSGAQITSSDFGSWGSDDDLIDISDVAAASYSGNRDNVSNPVGHSGSRLALSRGATSTTNASTAASSGLASRPLEFSSPLPSHLTRGPVVTSSDFGSWASDEDVIMATDTVSAAHYNTLRQDRKSTTQSETSHLPKPSASQDEDPQSHQPVPAIQLATSDYGSWGSESEMITAADIASANRNQGQGTKRTSVSESSSRAALARSVPARGNTARTSAHDTLAATAPDTTMDSEGRESSSDDGLPSLASIAKKLTSGSTVRSGYSSLPRPSLPASRAPLSPNLFRPPTTTPSKRSAKATGSSGIPAPTVPTLPSSPEPSTGSPTNSRTEQSASVPRREEHGITSTKNIITYSRKLEPSSRGRVPKQRAIRTQGLGSSVAPASAAAKAQKSAPPKPSVTDGPEPLLEESSPKAVQFEDLRKGQSFELQDADGENTGEWVTFQAAEAASSERVDEANRRALKHVGKDKYRDMVERKQIAVSFREGAVGLVRVLKSWTFNGHLTFGSKLNVDSDKLVQIEIWGPRKTSIDGQQPGWQRLARGVTRASKIIVGVPYRIPMALEGTNWEAQHRRVTITGNNPFYRLHDKFFQTVVENAENAPSTAILEPSAIRMMKDPKTRHDLIAEITKASMNAGSWTFLRGGPRPPQDMWSQSFRFCRHDQKDVTESAKWDQHIYAKRERALIPKGSVISGTIITLPNRTAIDTCGLVDLKNWQGIIQKDTFIWGIYEGVTLDMVMRYDTHESCVLSDAESSSPHYRISRLLRKFPRWEMRMFRLLSFDKKSPLLCITGGRYIAEQCMILFNDTAHQDLLRIADTVSEGNDLSYDGTVTILDAASDFALVNVLRQCHSIARRALNLRDIGHPDTIVAGQNWEMPIDHRHTLASIAWTCYELHDDNGVPYLRIHVRKGRIRAHLTASGRALTIAPGPSTDNSVFTLGSAKDRPEVPRGRDIRVFWESRLRGHGPHPNRLASVPIPGPLRGDIWDRAQDLALQIQYASTVDGTKQMEYLKVRGAKRREAAANASSIAKVLAETGVPYITPISILSSLENWRWTGRRSKPDWIKTRYHVRVHKYELDFFRRVWKCTLVSGDEYTPELVGGVYPLGPEAIQENHQHLVDLLSEDPRFLIGDKSLSATVSCEYELTRPIRPNELMASYDIDLPSPTGTTTTTTTTSYRCRQLGRECVFIRKHTGSLGILRRNTAAWRKLVGKGPEKQKADIYQPNIDYQPPLHESNDILFEQDETDEEAEGDSDIEDDVYSEGDEGLEDLGN